MNLSSSTKIKAFLFQELVTRKPLKQPKDVWIYGNDKVVKTLREKGIFNRYIVICREEYPGKVDGIEILPRKYFFKAL